ncbi:MAG: GlsB/YeaQ/YmgE family stress response membrane protein [Candidatus Helarchaeota archaeon]
MPEELRFLTTLIFWKLYETELNYTSNELHSVMENGTYKEKLYDGYYFENFDGQRMPLKWIATTGKYFLPVCMKCISTTFEHKDQSDIAGKIQIDAHIFPEGVVVMQGRLDFQEFMTIDQHIKASIPSDIRLRKDSTTPTLTECLDDYANELIDYFHTQFKRKKKTTEKTRASPWHHNWIWWRTQPEIPIQEFDIGGKYNKWALGMCTRSDKWSWLNPEKYAENIEAFYNLSPYVGNCVYITHPGNCIIPSPEFVDPNSVKNTLIDVIFAAELGNVQRYLILNHLQDFNFKSLEIQELLFQLEDDEKSLKDLIKKLEDIQDEINKRVLEVNYDLQITRTPRLIFTSVFKTKIFRQMIDSLHGYDFLKSLDLLIDEIKDSLSRERDVVSVKASEQENVFLRNLQIVFIVELVASLLSLFFVTGVFEWDVGSLIIINSIIGSLIVLYLLKRIR